HLEMVGAVVAGDGLERVAEVAGQHAGAPVALIVPRVGAGVEAWSPYERYVGWRLAGGTPRRPPEITAEVPIVSGDEELGAVLLLGSGKPEAGEFLHVAAIAALTEVAVAEARDETEQSLRGSFLEELLTREDLETEDVLRRAARLGCDLAQGCAALCADPGERAPGRLIAAHPEEVRSFYEDTIAPLVRYDEQYSTDLVGTLAGYLGNDCNMNATAQAIHAHRHTVAYRLERVKELTGLDPLKSEDRERLGLGLKAYRIIAPRLPR